MRRRLGASKGFGDGSCKCHKAPPSSRRASFSGFYIGTNRSQEEMKDYDDDVTDTSGSANALRCTRSQVAPDWSVIESLILVNEVAAVEADCSVALSSYQQWNIIAQNCAALDVPRNLSQCRRKWQELLSDHDRLKGTAAAGGKFPPNFNYELFEAVERVVRAREERGMADPQSDTEAGNDARDVTVEIGTHRSNVSVNFVSLCYWKNDTPNIIFPLISFRKLYIV